MSTYMYLVCLSHDPPLESDCEVGQHSYDLKEIRQYIANRKVYEANSDAGIDLTYHTSWQHAAARFLSTHRKCDIGIRNEYGGTYLTGIGDSEQEIK